MFLVDVAILLETATTLNTICEDSGSLTSNPGMSRFSFVSLSFCTLFEYKKTRFKRFLQQQ